MTSCASAPLRAAVLVALALAPATGAAARDTLPVKPGLRVRLKVDADSTWLVGNVLTLGPQRGQLLGEGSWVRRGDQTVLLRDTLAFDPAAVVRLEISRGVGPWGGERWRGLRRPARLLPRPAPRAPGMEAEYLEPGMVVRYRLSPADSWQVGAVDGVRPDTLLLGGDSRALDTLIVIRAGYGEVLRRSHDSRAIPFGDIGELQILRSPSFAVGKVAGGLALGTTGLFASALVGAVVDATTGADAALALLVRSTWCLATAGGVAAVGEPSSFRHVLLGSAAGIAGGGLALAVATELWPLALLSPSLAATYAHARWSPGWQAVSLARPLGGSSAGDRGAGPGSLVLRGAPTRPPPTGAEFRLAGALGVARLAGLQGRRRDGSYTYRGDPDPLQGSLALGSVVQSAGRRFFLAHEALWLNVDHQRQVLGWEGAEPPLEASLGRQNVSGQIFQSASTMGWSSCLTRRLRIRAGVGVAAMLVSQQRRRGWDAWDDFSHWGGHVVVQASRPVQSGPQPVLELRWRWSPSAADERAAFSPDGVQLTLAYWTPPARFRGRDAVAAGTATGLVFWLPMAIWLGAT